MRLTAMQIADHIESRLGVRVNATLVRLVDELLAKDEQYLLTRVLTYRWLLGLSITANALLAIALWLR